MEHLTTKFDYQRLDQNGDGHDADKNPVRVQATEDVPFIIADLARIDFVEDLPHTHRKQKRLRPTTKVSRAVRSGSTHLTKYERVEEERIFQDRVVALEKVLAKVEDAKKDNELVNALSDDVPPHGGGDEGIVAPRGWF